VVALTSGETLLTFDSSTPAKFTQSPVISGVLPDDGIANIAFRPSNGKLYGLGLTHLYTLDPTTGVATPLNNSNFFLEGVTAASFDPVTDLLRATSEVGINILINPNDGTLAGSFSALAYASGDPNFGRNVRLSSLAYTNEVAGATSTTLFGFNALGDRIDNPVGGLVTVGGPDQVPSPDDGQVFTVADTAYWSAFTIAPDNTALAVIPNRDLVPISTLWTVDLTGKSLDAEGTMLGDIGQVVITSMAVEPGGAVGVPYYSVGDTSVSKATTGPVNAVFTVSLSVPFNLPTQVSYATSDGTAVAGRDYQFTSGILTFAPGATSETLTVPVLPTPASSSPLDFYVILSNPTKNTALGRSKGIGVIRADGMPSGPVPTGYYKETFSQEINVGKPGWMTTDGIFQHTLVGGSAQIQPLESAPTTGFPPSAPDEVSLSGVDTISFPLLTSNSIFFARVDVLVKSGGAAVRFDGTNGTALFILTPPKAQSVTFVSVSGQNVPPPGTPPPRSANTGIVDTRPPTPPDSGTWMTVSVGLEHLLPNGIELGPILSIDLIGVGPTAFDDVTIVVGPPHPPPPVVNPTVFALPGTTTPINLLTQQFDPDGDSLVVDSLGAVDKGAIVPNPHNPGSVDYTPPAGFTGVDSFTYVVKDSQGATATVTVTVNVAVFANVSSAVNGGAAVTLVAGDPLDSFVNLQAQKNPDPAGTLPAGTSSAEFPLGFFGFELHGLTAGAHTTVTMLYPEGVTVDRYYKFGPTLDGQGHTVPPHWYDFGYDPASDTGAETHLTNPSIPPNEVVLHFVDGQRGDDDLTANGVIVDPGGPALVTQTRHFAVTGTPAGTTAGAPFTIAVSAQDTNRYTDTTYPGTIHFSSTDPHAELPADYTFTPADFGNHVFTIWLKTAGLQTIRVTDGTRPAYRGTSSAIRVTAGAPSGLGLAGFPSLDITGARHRIILTALDAFGNRAGSYRGTVHFTSSDPNAVLPTDYTFQPADHGRHTFWVTLKSEGSQSVFVQDSGSIGEQSGILVVSPATHLVIRGLPKTFKAGMPFTITVQAFDALGRPDLLFQDAIHFSSSDPLAVLPGDYAFQPADNGQQSFTIILRSPGTRKVIVTDLVRPALKVVLLVAL
jgi:hypothetical protein